MQQSFPLFLAIVLYLLIFWLRSIQGGWDIEIDLFPGLRNEFDKKIIEYLPSPQVELLSGIILGQNSELPGKFRLALRDTSTLHIVVASGQNLSMVAGFFFLLSGLIKRKLALFLSFSAVLFYVLLTGAQVPILRAAIMVSVGFLAQILGKEKISSWVMVLTGGLMLLINPKWLFDLSFQLSFLATFGVVSVAPIFMKYLKILPGFLSQDLSVSLAAQIMVFPIIAYNFHQLSLVAIPANLLVLWTVPIIMILGAVLLILSFIFGGLAAIVALALNILLTYFIYVVEFFAGLPFAWEYVGEFNGIVWVGYYLVLAGFMLSLSYVKQKDFRRSEKGS